MFVLLSKNHTDIDTYHLPYKRHTLHCNQFLSSYPILLNSSFDAFWHSILLKPMRYFGCLIASFAEPIIDMLWIIPIVPFVPTFNMFLEPFINLFHIILWFNSPNTYKIRVLHRLYLQDALYHRCMVCSIYKYYTQLHIYT